ARKLVKSKYVNLVNILLDEEAVPELLLENCRPIWIADETSKLLSDAEAVGRQRQRLTDALAKLSRDGLSPSRAAARVVLDTMKKGRS
ncbi:MAG: lipid-A-disaccharide synthase, partial [Rhodospirillales bacterium]|nr:lipid-A-disaccharide synthase [Rhodospirillales bacterium]